ncbi:AAA family ATPase [Azotobacter vinelandii]
MSAHKVPVKVHGLPDSIATVQMSLFFDALLVKYRERIPILAAAESKRLKTIAVWFRTPLEVCLARNAARAADELVPEQAVRNVYVAIEPPTRAEGFERVIQVYPVEADA